MLLQRPWRGNPTNAIGEIGFRHFSPRSGRQRVAQGKSAQPWVSVRLLTVSPRSGRQKKLHIRDVRAAAAARCAGLAANVPTSPGLRRLALGYTLSPATRVRPIALVATNCDGGIQMLMKSSRASCGQDNQTSEKVYKALAEPSWFDLMVRTPCF